MKERIMNPSKTILIVDDEDLNLKLLEVNLVSQGYRILKATHGEGALAEALKEPDLILLDIMMPGLDGFETCRRLKESEKTRSIPVIFLSAFQSPKTKVKGLEIGGVDYVSKPFDSQELFARVRLHLLLREQELQIKRYAMGLEEMVEERARQLIHADRLATLGTFSAAMGHEISNPITYIDGNVELVQLTLDSMRQIAENRDGTEIEGILELSGQMEEMLVSIKEGTRRITEVIGNLRSYGRGNENRNGKCLLIDVIRDALTLLHHRTKCGASVETEVSPELEIECNRQKICQVFVNLINNALDAMGDGEKQVTIRAESVDGQTKIEIKDNGPGIPEGIGKRIFEPFFTTKGEDHGTGLGLFIVRSIVEEHHGTISLNPYDGKGACFNITLPGPEGLRNPSYGEIKGSAMGAPMPEGIHP
jgi:two-component system, NtrC family, sensor kinase